MNIIDIVQYTTWDQVKRAIKYFYPNDKNDYQSLYESIKTWEKKPQRYKTERVEMLAINYDALMKEYYKEDRYYDVHTSRKRSKSTYSMSFRKWEELASIEISENVLEYMRFEDILAHFIWEITFYGPPSEANKLKKEIMKRAKEAEISIKGTNESI